MPKPKQKPLLGPPQPEVPQPPAPGVTPAPAPPPAPAPFTAAAAAPSPIPPDAKVPGPVSPMMTAAAGGLAGPGIPGAPGPGPVPPPGTPPPPGDTASAAKHLRSYLDPRISEGQWEAWVKEGNYDPAGCPPATPFHSMRGNSGGACVEKPVDCPEGMYLQGENCVSGGGGGGVGGPGSPPFPGPGGPGGPGGPVGETSPFGGDFQKMFEERLRALFGAPSRYSPETIQGITGGVKSAAEGAAQQQMAAADEDAAARGLFRSGIAGANAAKIRAGVGAQTTQAYSDLLNRKVAADAEDKQFAFQQAKGYLDSLQQQSQFMTMTAEQRRQFNANMSLAYARLAQEKDQFGKSLQAQFDLTATRAGLGGLGF